MAQSDPVPDQIAAAAKALARGDFDSARVSILSIDQPGIVAAREAALRRVWGPGGVGNGATLPKGQVRQAVRPTLQRAVFRRDHFTCRYAHCRRRTIYLPVLRALSRALPDLVPYHRNWKPVSAQVLYWAYATSLEHHRSFPLGGSSDESNLLTACYQCNDLKNWLDAEALGWTVGPPADSGWDGLEALLPQLRASGFASA